MMQRIRFALLALAGVTSIATAQRGGSGCQTGRERSCKSDDRSATMAQVKPGLRLTNGDVEDMSPIRTLLDKRRDLKLTDDQLKQIRDMEKKLRDDTKPEFKSLDSLRDALRMSGTDQTAAEELRQRLAREQVTSVLSSIRTDYDAAEKAALALLDATQLPKAQDYLAKQRKDGDEVLKDKLGPGMSMTGGGGGRRP